MVHRFLALVLLAGCSIHAVGEPADTPSQAEAKRNAALVAEARSRPPLVVAEPEIVAVAPRAAARVDPTDPPEWHLTCDQRRERLRVREAELEAERERRTAYVREHCVESTKRDVRIYRDGEERPLTRPVPVWMCDGKPVDVPQTAREQVLMGIIMQIHDKLKSCP